jgi:hypothetical protein
MTSPLIPASGLDARVEVGLDDLAAEDLIGADAAVVAALRRREPVLGEAERTRAVEERVFLLDPEPRVVRRVLLRHLGVRGARVRGMR